MRVIATNLADCKDCYKCVRHCPMKAIRIVGAHAEIVEDKCVADGTCVSICPQKAKHVKDSREEVKSILQGRAALSIAPSYIAAFGVEPGKIARAARELGFEVVSETADAALDVAAKHRELEGGPWVASACPVVVNLIEKYFPEHIGSLAPVASPMVVHGRMLKKRYGDDLKVVFVGPCIAKKGEARREDSSVDAVLTFGELLTMFEEAGISLSDLEPSGFDVVGAGARVFPVEGGLIKSAGLPADLLSADDIVITGLEECREALSHLERFQGVRLLELMSCRGGCIAGPCIGTDDDIYTRRRRVLEYARCECDGCSEGVEVDFGAVHSPRPVDLPIPDEQAIKEVLAKTDKLSAKDELNCGACGYNSCREKAVAVIQGMAEVEMCIPYMRARAESMSNLIIRSTPNGIIVVDRDFKIVSINPAFEAFFQCRPEDLVGRPVQEVMDVEGFETVFSRRELLRRESVYRDGRLRTREYLFYVGKRDVVVAIVNDMTTEQRQREAITKAREETLAKASKVIDRQMRVAQEIAGLLGETTAETKVLLTQLMKEFQSEEGRKP